MPHSHSHGGGHGHSHGNGNGNQKMNNWTKANLVGDFIEGIDNVTTYLLVDISLVLAIMAWIKDSSPDTDSDVFTYTTATACFLVSLLGAFSSSYCHGILNMQHQTEEKSESSDCDQEDDDDEDSHEEIPPEIRESIIAAAKNILVTSSEHDSSGHNGHPDDSHGHSHDHHGHNHHSPSHAVITAAKKSQLTRFQVTSIYFNAVAYGMGRAGSLLGNINFIVRYATKANQLSNPANLTSVILASLFGFFTSKAEFVTCSESISRYNRRVSGEKLTEDLAANAEKNQVMNLTTRINQIGEALDGVQSVSTYLIAGMKLTQALIAWSEGETVVEDSDDFTWITLAVTLTIGGIVGLGAGYCHGILNMQHQAPEDVDVSNLDKQSIMTAEDRASALSERLNRVHVEFTTSENLSANLSEHLITESDNVFGLPRTSSRTPEEKPAAVILKKKPVTFSTLQKLAIPLDAVAHGTGRAGSLIAGCEIILQYSLQSKKISTPLKLGTFIGATFFGALTSGAEVKTCMEAIRRHVVKKTR